jgi:3-oxoacyl-[acyl-carrier-protein] synthase II
MTTTDETRIVITGLGAVTPIGIGRDAFWEGLMSGRCGVGQVQAFDTAGLPVERAYEVRGFDPAVHLRLIPGSQGRPLRLGRATQFALAAAFEALEDAGVALPLADPERVGLCLGTIGGELRVLEHITCQLHRGGEVDPWCFGQLSYETVAREVAVILGVTGPLAVVPTACAAGNYSLGLARHLIRAGDVDMIIAGGADPLSHMIMSGFCRLKAVDSDFCRPFDLNRKGLMVGEGAGVLVLEELYRARARGARIYAEVAGCGLSCDAFHVTAMEPEGKGLALAIERALAQAGISSDHVDYISAHGTGTPTNDRVETLAVKRVFKERASKVPISSIKSMVGHAMGAASALEAVACAMVIAKGAIPPTMNFRTPDPECELDVVPNAARDLDARVVLSNAAAFGGNNSCVVFRAVS